MKKQFKVLPVGVLTMLVVVTSCAKKSGPPDELFKEAKAQKKRAYYTEASRLYKDARQGFIRKGSIAMAEKCRIEIFNMEKVRLDYKLTEDEAKEKLDENFKNTPKATKYAWLRDGTVQSMQIDGKPYYYEDFIKNLMFRKPELISEEGIEKEGAFYRKCYGIIFRKDTSGYKRERFRPYVNPHAYLVTETLSLKRKDLPRYGVMKLWFPVPILLAQQSDVKLISVSPSEYVEYPPTIGRDLGTLYMEIDLKNLKDDLSVELKSVFTHYEQQFVIDPSIIGEYDKESDLYKRYTVSYGNTQITPEIKSKARKIVGSETNAYLCAKKIYDYIVANIKYSLMPHCALDALGKPESVYVHENGFGDCGAQGAYFSALCRSLGIPARTIGGYQMCPGVEGSHFWASFFLPNYGWVPVDTSVAQTIDYDKKVPEADRLRFKRFYFGNQDPYRCVIQEDIDIPLVPPAGEPTILSMALQYPAVVCRESEKNLGPLVTENFKISFEILEK